MEWKDTGLINRAVLTYHFGDPNAVESLYVCLEIPLIEEPAKPKIEVSQETVEKKVPSIMQYVNRICQGSNIKPRIFDYTLDVEQSKKENEKKGTSYYDGASTEEILRFASAGTKIALEVLSKLEENENTWMDDTQLSEFILSRLRNELGPNYRWMHWALHFTCNPLLIPEYCLMYPLGNRAIRTIKSNS